MSLFPLERSHAQASGKAERESIDLPVNWKISGPSRRERVELVTASAQPPRIDHASLPLLDEVDGRLLTRSDERDRQQFSECDLTGRDLTGSAFTECALSMMTLHDTQLRGSRFVECTLTDSFAPSLLAGRTSWRDVLVENPRWGSAELYDADLTSVHVRGGKIDYLNLRTSKITDLLVEDCTITDLDLGGCRGTRIALRDCRVGTLDLTRAVMRDVDLRSTSLSALNGIEGLSGVTIDDFQLALFAPIFAAHLGVAVD
jgi:uncharacterized protein YjbI with pentapeptide repeats